MNNAQMDVIPRSAVVVGAGIVGLSTAWFLQERGVEVTVVDRDDVAAGSSWGNAGWLSPGLAIPLNEPNVLRYGIRSLVNPRAPLHVPARLDPGLWRFLTQFAAHCTWREWDYVVQAQRPFNADCLEAFDVLTANGVSAPTIKAPITAAFAGPKQAAGLLRELHRITEAGQPIEYTGLTGAELAEQIPQLSDRAGAGVQLTGQRYVDPGEFVRSLAKSVLDRGATIRSNFKVTDVHGARGNFAVRSTTGQSVKAETVVLATGAWLDELSKARGVRVPVRAGRGYSFTVPTDEPVPGPIYLPDARVACTPYHGGLRVAGTMEFRGADDSLDQSRVDAIISSARGMFAGVSWQDRTDTWVGPRPVSSDGRALVGATRTPGLFVAGGHGMWGFTHGPITGRLLTEQITTGKQPAALRQFDPLRRVGYLRKHK